MGDRLGTPGAVGINHFELFFDIFSIFSLYLHFRSISINFAAHIEFNEMSIVCCVNNICLLKLLVSVRFVLPLL